MASFRYWYRLISAFVNRFKLKIFIGVIAGLLLFSLGRFLFPMLSSHQEYIGLTGRYHTEELPLEVLSLIGNGLTKLDSDGEVRPDLAESWTSQEDGRVWVFKIKSNLVWHDGTPVTARSIQYSFEDAEIEIPDDYTIIFKLASPFSPFPTVVSKPTFKRGLLGTGEWRVNKISLSSSFVDFLELVNISGQKRVYKFYPTEDRTKVAYELGEVDSVVLLDPEPFTTWQTAEVEKDVSYDRFVGIFFNNDSDLFRDNKTLRQALSYAIDKQSFPGPRALGPVSPESWAYNSQVKEYKYDVSRAKDILGEVPNDQQENLSITLTTTPTLLGSAERVAGFWREVGVNTEVKVVSILPDDFQAFLAIYDIPKDPDQYATWHSTQLETNITMYQNPRVDKLLEDGRLQLDHEARKKIYLDFQRFLLEDAPVVFLYHPLRYTVTRR